MCGRYTLTVPPSAIATAFGLTSVPALQPRYNIAPTQAAAIVRSAAAGVERTLDNAHWGLIPSWAKNPSMGVRLINARAETLSEKPAFRTALQRRRCLVPADGFIEWVADGKLKQPWWITLETREPFAFAGLWESWKPKDAAAPIESFTIITTEANDSVRAVHTRMPVMLPPEAHEDWLDPERRDTSALMSWLAPCAWAKLHLQPISRRINNARNDDPECVAPQSSSG